MSPRNLLLFSIIATAVVALDLATKSYVFEDLLAGRPRVDVFGGGVFELVKHLNPGGMWGIGQEWNPWILRSVRIVAVIVIFYILFKTSSDDRLAVVSLGLVLGGAVGNIYDSLRYGAVRDFLKFDFDFPVFDPFPTFNIADSAICIGVFLLAVQMLFFAPKEENTSPSEPQGG